MMCQWLMYKIILGPDLSLPVFFLLSAMEFVIRMNDHDTSYSCGRLEEKN